jgi:RNA polymerase sigma factor (sigma-70 family)
MTGLPVWEHWDAMVRASRNVLGCDDEALDCAAEAMTQVLERRPTDVANLEAFLVTVAKRRAIDRLRSRQRARRRDQLLAGQVALDAPDVADDVVSRAEALWADARAQQLLKPHVYRLVRLLADGVPMQEAASRLGMSDRGAQSHLLRARRTIRKAMAQALAVLAGALAYGRKLVPASSPAVAVGVVAATALFVAPPAPATSDAAVPPTAEGPRLEPVRAAQAPNPAAQAPTPPAAPVRQSKAPAAAPVGPPGEAATESARTVVARTPAVGVETYDSDDGHRSGGPVEMVMHCVGNLTVTVGYQGC